jgi:hypothetical protein
MTREPMEEVTVSAVSERIEHFDASVESAQSVLDHAQRALNAIEAAQEHAEHAVTALRRTALVVMVGSAVLVGLALLRRRAV